MTENEKQKWLELCGRIAKEEDPKKLSDLIAELSRILDADEERGKGKTSGVISRRKS